MEMKLPVDFERWMEFRELVEYLRKSEAGKQSTRISEMAANFMVIRLWVDLCYLAQSTNRSGWLTKQAADMYERSLEPLFGEDAHPVQLLELAKVLRAEPDGWFCERFARLNAELAGNYIKKEVRAAAASALKRNENRIANEALAQGMLLPPELFKRRDGKPILGSDADHVLIIIKTIDNQLKRPARQKHTYTEGLMMDAAEVLDNYRREDLKAFYEWLFLHRDQPSIPQTTEQILADFKTVWVKFQAAKGN